MAVVKNLQFLSNQADIQATLPTHELIILTKFHKDWQENMDFIAVTNFEPVYFFLHQSLPYQRQLENNPLRNPS